MSKRTFYELRQLLLTELAQGPLTINLLAKKADINWRTVRSHLSFLKSTGDVTELVESQYVRIFALTEQGKKNAALIRERKSEPDSVRVNILRERVEIL